MAAKKAKKKVQIFPIVNTIIMILFVIITLYPVLNTLAMTVRIPFVEVSICYRENLHGRTTLRYFRKTT